MNEETNHDREPGKSRAGWILAALFFCVIGVGIGFVLTANLDVMNETRAENAITQEHPPQTIDQNGISILQKTQESFRQIVQMAKPAVVTIETKKEVTSSLPFSFGPDDSFFFDPFRDRMRTPDREEEKRYDVTGGSGFFVSHDGYILTNNHVVSDAVTITIITDEQVEYSAELVGTDPMTDVALLKINNDEVFPYLDLGNSEDSQIGDWVIAIGSPIKLAQTVTVGIISGKNREDVKIGSIDYSNFIQTDAAINFGNSGGPLLDVYGRVIGINTAIAGGANVSGIGFAIPSNMAKFAYENLKAHGEVIRGWIGGTIQEVDADLAKALGLNRPRGALINSIIEGDLADKAGLKVGDVILEIDGEMVPSHASLSRMIAEKHVGNQVKLKILRGKEQIEINIVPDRRPEDVTSRLITERSEQKEDAIGLTLGELTPEIRQRLGVPENLDGIYIIDVRRNSVASDKMFFKYDIISEINDKPIRTLKDYEEAIADSGNVAKFRVHRQQLTGGTWTSFFIGVPIG